MRSCVRVATVFAAQANLSLYTTSDASDDLDDLRAALGYPQLVLFGGSYGTRFYLDYARRHPDSVETIVLKGVAPPHYYTIPLPMARGAQTAIDNLERACRLERTCSADFRDFAEHFAAIVRRFDSGPVTLTPSKTRLRVARSSVVRLTKEVFAETIAPRDVFPDGRRVHSRYDRARISRRLQASARWSVRWRSSSPTFKPMGSTCRSRAPKIFRSISEADVAQYSAGTFEGDVRVRAQQRACKLWNVASAPAFFRIPYAATRRSS